ncbi:MAG: hypothetical protein LBB40_00590 [Holophagales bacterium]|jgi:hypothetical protein|nr:hypothetical protein [Holophagales bacterium]
MCNLVILKSFIAVLLLACGSMFAQQPGQWVNDYFIIDNKDLSPDKRFLDNENKIHKTILNITKAKDFPIERKYIVFARKSFWRNDALYTCAMGPSEMRNGIKYMRVTLAKYTDDGWSYIGGFETENTSITTIPCDGNRFVAISYKHDLTGNTGFDRSPFTLLSVAQNDQIKVSNAIHPTESMHDPEWFKLPSASSIVMTDKYAVLINARTGLYWILSLEKALLTRSGRIFKISDEIISKGGFAEAVLCVQPEKDGNILVSAIDEKSMLESSDLLGELKEMLRANPTISQEDLGKIIKKRSIEQANKNWRIEWYRINPEKGSVIKLNLPPLGSALYRDGTNDFWRPTLDGSVKIGLEKGNTDSNIKK